MKPPSGRIYERKIKLCKWQLASERDGIAEPKPRTAEFTSALVSHLKNRASITCLQLSVLVPITTTILWHSGNSLTHICGGQTAVSVGRGTRNCWLNSFWGSRPPGSQQAADGSLFGPGAHDEVGLGGDTISKCYKTTFLIPVECSQGLKQRTKSAIKSPFM